MCDRNNKFCGSYCNKESNYGKGDLGFSKRVSETALSEMLGSKGACHVIGHSEET